MYDKLFNKKENLKKNIDSIFLKYINGYYFWLDFYAMKSKPSEGNSRILDKLIYRSLAGFLGLLVIPPLKAVTVFPLNGVLNGYSLSKTQRFSVIQLCIIFYHKVFFKF